MLINRRQALIGMGLAAFSRAAWSLPNSLLPPLSEWTHFDFNSPADSVVDDRLRDDLARLAPRIYSEEGIPVFLACVNLVPAQTLRQSAKAIPPPLSAALSAAFRRNAEAFQRLRPDAKVRDIGPLIEVLADRDFSNGETREDE